MQRMWHVVEAQCRCWYSLNVGAVDVVKKTEWHDSVPNTKPPQHLRMLMEEMYGEVGGIEDNSSSRLTARRVYMGVVSSRDDAGSQSLALPAFIFLEGLAGRRCRGRDVSVQNVSSLAVTRATLTCTGRSTSSFRILCI